MADVKISALPLATTPLAGTEVLPIVQSATTDQVSVANLTAGRAVSAASLTLTTTPLAVGSGGTGLTSLTAGYIPYGNGTSAFSSNASLYFTGSALGVNTSGSASGTVDAKANAYSTFVARASTSGSGQNVDVLKVTDSGVAYFANANYYANSHIWNIVGSQAMTLDASGNLTVSNTASPAFTVSGSTSAFNNTVSGSYSSQLVQYASGESYWQSNGTVLNFGTTSNSPFTFKTNNTERMRIDSSGNVGIGTSSPGGRLEIGNPSDANQMMRFRFPDSSTAELIVSRLSTGNLQALRIQAQDGIQFYVNGSERARIDASGNLLVGTTSTSNTVVGWKFLPAVNGSGFVCDTTGDGPTISVTNINATIANGYRWFSFRINSGGTQVGSISYNTGTSQVNYNQTSDRRIKSNITPALPVLDKMKQVEVVSFDMGQGHTDYGVIAQDLHKLFPEAVSVGDDLDKPETLWGFAGASLVPAMVKAIQELAAKVAELEAKI